MSENENKKLSTDSYKGVRDFYPEDMAVQNYIFGIWKETAQKFGYAEYNASVLEPAELYRAKTGEEIVNEQTYTFTDRGEREVTLRPEMTPTVARMVAGKKRELAFPLRWYSIPNLFRYEQPQRGRLREHWQLNVDIFGIKTTHAEIELISMAYEMLRSFGLKDTDFEIRINNRKVMNYIFKDIFSLSNDDAKALSKIVDRKEKTDKKVFEENAEALLKDKTRLFLTLMNSKNFEEFTAHLPQTKEEHEGIREIKETIAGLEALGINNTVFDQTIMRGFDYYTGVVFEVFDKNPKNRRSVFGGGRYDDLLALFGNEKVPAFGFGYGDVVMKDLLETYNLIPAYVSPAQLSLCPTELKFAPYASECAQTLRAEGIATTVDYTERKIGDKIKTADKQAISFIAVIGETEIESGKLTIKNLATGEEKTLDLAHIPQFIKTTRNT